MKQNCLTWLAIDLFIHHHFLAPKIIVMYTKCKYVTIDFDSSITKLATIHVIYNIIYRCLGWRYPRLGWGYPRLGWGYPRLGQDCKAIASFRYRHVV